MIFRKLLLSRLPLLALILCVFSCNKEAEEVEDRSKVIEERLKKLPKTRFALPFWNLGCSSHSSSDPFQESSVQVEFDKPALVDLVVLMPTAFLVSDNSEYSAYGFPKRFIIEGLKENGNKVVIADYSERDYPYPDLIPQSFYIAEGVVLTGIRLNVLEMVNDSSWMNRSYTFALSEIFVFSGKQNVALGCDVEFERGSQTKFVWDPTFLTDGITYSSPLNISLSLPKMFYAKSSVGSGTVILCDLGGEYKIDEFHLWPHKSGSPELMMARATIRGFPRDISIEISSSLEPETRSILFQTNEAIDPPGTAPYVRRVAPKAGRYLWITVDDFTSDYLHGGDRLLLSQICFLSQGKVISKEADVRVEKGLIEGKDPDLSFLTSGRTGQGLILEQRKWIKKIVARKKLEAELVSLDIKRKRFHEETRRNILWLSAAFFGLIIVGVGFYYFSRIRQNRQLAIMRDNIADDLHDELGANLSSITLSASILEEELEGVDGMPKNLIHQIINVSRSSAEQTRDLIYFLETARSLEDIENRIQVIGDELLAGFDFHMDIHAESKLVELETVKQWHLLLFIKEALNNVAKHSHADTVSLVVVKANGGIKVVVKDDGVGLRLTQREPGRLKKRAAKLGGTLEFHSSKNQGPERGFTVILQINE